MVSHALIRTLLVAVLLLSVPAWADDGDPLTGASTAKNMDGGAMWSAAFVFCEAKIAADSTCDEFDLEAHGGTPTHFVVSIDSANNCTAGYDVDLIGHTTSGGDPHVWTTVDALISSQQVTGPTHRFLSGSITSAGCDLTGGPGLTAHIVLFYDRN